MVLSREDQPSLWNGMIILVFGRFSRYSFCLQLQKRKNERVRLRQANTTVSTYALHIMLDLCINI